MEKEFIPYEQASALKELGFDEPCFNVYDTMGYLQDEQTMLNMRLDYCSAPLYQQAFRWFREKGLYHDIKMFGDWDKPQFSYIVSGRIIINATNPNHIWSYYKNANSYEEAELDCLNKLIGIVKNNQK